MNDMFWIFLSVAVFMGVLLLIVLIATQHRSTMRKLEIEALKIEQATASGSDQHLPK
ncbi:hypothetical protein [Nakamurella multipartita]|uniref:Uncharacterized protein n=1 Tax=Nakamurella multipartita (strain ATCC 700099 / DSM 44233 / CIP 104796 / JCM 9543 / NBRC 105858 / Y-104) TaxID=479431 RepID=C8X7M6_NAKMY|nr:hypothetical protein [Nakamurella multipartita]ACV78979.1 hypothetical protein Namu_2630 [Nakamurella multipartita DSM 44233]